MKKLHKLSAAVLVACSLTTPGAQASGIPTVDIANLLAEVIVWGKQFTEVATQIKEAQAQYQQLKQTYDKTKESVEAIKGARGMGDLLNNQDVRLQLDPGFLTTVDKLRNLGASGASAQAQTIYDSVKAFDCAQQFPGLPAERKRCEAQAMMVPTTIAFLNDSVKRSEARAKELQGLIAKIDQAPDVKAAADLQNRIQSEVTLLANEKHMVDLATAQLKAQAELNKQLAAEVSLKRIVGGGVNPFGTN